MKIFSCFNTKGIFWFRLLGYGLVIKDIRIYPLLFSERNKYIHYLKIKNILIKSLYPRTLK